MAGKGRKFKFHGAFASKSDAMRKKSRVRGFIRKVSIKGHRRYVVMTRRKG